MKMPFKKISLALLFTLAILAMPICAALADPFYISAPIPSPTILSTAEIDETNTSQVTVHGLSQPGLQINIYINGQYEGIANISQIDNGISRFSYLSPSLTMPSSPFEVMVIAENSDTHELSAPAMATVNSVIDHSTIKSSLPSQTVVNPNSLKTINPPVLLSPNQLTCLPTLRASGISLNGSYVKIYLDDQLFGTTSINFEPAISSSFTFISTKPLVRGEHRVYAIAADANGLQSVKSNVLSFCTLDPQILTAASSTADINTETGSSTITDNSTASATPVLANTAKPMAHKTNGKYIISCVIFILFVCVLLIWMLLINRELGQENTNNDSDQLPNTSIK